MRRSVTAPKGFTLVEILVAMTLTALLLGILTAGMRAVVDEWQDTSNPFEDQLDASLVYLQIEQALFGAAPASYIDQDTLEQDVFFDGADDSISWVSTISPQARQQLTAWRLADGDRDGVILKTTPAFTDDPTERLDDATGTLALPGLRLTVAYLDLDDQGRPDWLDEWNGAEHESLPMAVRLRFEGTARGDDSETQIIVPIIDRQHETIQPVDTQ
jgi:general secretion pathway protein J